MDAGIGAVFSTPAAVRPPLAATRVPPTTAANEAGGRPAPVRAATVRAEFERDAATQSLVFRMIDVASGSVTYQSPSEAQLRLRAYIDSVVEIPAPVFDATA